MLLQRGVLCATVADARPGGVLRPSVAARQARWKKSQPAGPINTSVNAVVPHNCLPAALASRDLCVRLGRSTAPKATLKKDIAALPPPYCDMWPDLGDSGLIPYRPAAALMLRTHGVVCRYHAVDVVEARAPGLARIRGKRLVATLLGHVDHGKTTLLTRWAGRDFNTAELGGITQGVRAVGVPLPQGVVGMDTPAAAGPTPPSITVLDTPGHRLFKLFRDHGSFVCDVVVLVIDATAGVQRQTTESMRLTREYHRPVVVCVTKVDLVPPADLRPTLAALKAKLEKGLEGKVTFNFRKYLQDCGSSSRDAALAGGETAGMVPAVPVSALHGLQTDDLLRVVHAAASRGAGEAAAEEEWDAEHHPGAPQPSYVRTSAHAAVVLDAVADARIAGKEATYCEEELAAFAPHRTRVALQALKSNAEHMTARGTFTTQAQEEWGLLCLAKRGGFAVGRPAFWIAGRRSWGDTRRITDEFGVDLPAGTVVPPGVPFVVYAVRGGGELPAPGAHLLGVASKRDVDAVLEHRDSITSYLEGGGDPSLLTPAGDPDAYGWLIDAAIDDDTSDDAGATGAPDFDVNELEARGLLCPSWARTMTCKNPACRKAHPPNLATEPPIARHIVLCADTQGSLKILEEVVPMLDDVYVKFNIIRSQLGAPDVNSIVFAANGGSFEVPLICYKLALPRHMVPIATTQSVEVFEIGVLADVVRTLDRLARPLYDEWLGRQEARWARFGVPERQRVVRRKKRSKVVSKILAEDTEEATLVDVYGTAA